MSHTKHPIYSTWLSMRQRCSNSKTPGYHRYGGRGIRVCKRWDDFKAFLEDMGERPNGTSLDRIDNEGNYEPSNCRWATHLEQQANKSHQRFVRFDGVEYRLADLARESGLKPDTIISRANKGMSLEQCIAKTRYVFMGGYRKAIEVRVANQLSATHCRKGHTWQENTLLHKQGRLCRECYRIRKGIKCHKS